MLELGRLARHDRDISHSSVERVACADAFHLAHYMVLKFTEVMAGLRVYPQAMAENLAKTRGLIFSQNVLKALLATGLDRQEAYAAVQAAAMAVWENQAPDFITALRQNPRVTASLTDAALQRAFDLNAYTQHLTALFARAGLES